MGSRRPSCPELEATDDRNKICPQAEDVDTRCQARSEVEGAVNKPQSQPEVEGVEMVHQSQPEVEGAGSQGQSQPEVEGPNSRRQLQSEVDDADGKGQSQLNLPCTSRCSYSMRERRPSQPEVECVCYRHKSQSEVEDEGSRRQSQLELKSMDIRPQFQPEVDDAGGKGQSQLNQPWTSRCSYTMRERRPSQPEVECVRHSHKLQSEVEFAGDKQESQPEVEDMCYICNRRQSKPEIEGAGSRPHPKHDGKNAGIRFQSQPELEDAGNRLQSNPVIEGMGSRQQTQLEVGVSGSRRHSQLEVEDEGSRCQSQLELKSMGIRPQSQPEVVEAEVKDAGSRRQSLLEVEGTITRPQTLPEVIDAVSRHQSLPEVVESASRLQSLPEMEGAGGRRPSLLSQAVPWTRRNSYPIVETQGRLSIQEVKDSKWQYIKQIIYCVIVSSSQCMIGIMIGWPAVLPRLTEDELSGFQLAHHSGDFLVSCVFLSGLFTNLIAGYLMEIFGPRRLVLFAMPPVIISYISQVFYINIWVLFVGRMVIGISSSIVMVAAQPLVAELCCPQIRGFLSSLPETFNALGLLLVYICAQNLHFRWVTGLCALPPLLTLLCLIKVPESPYWLVSKGKMDLAEKSVKDLYGDGYQKELMEIKDNIKQATYNDQMKEIKHPRNYKPVCLVIALFWIKECAGYQFIFSYAGHLFEESDVAIDSSWCPILIGLCRLIFTSISAVVVDWKGRRPLLMSSSAICGLSLIVAGLSRYYGANLSSIISVLVFTSSFGIGEGPIVCMLNGELVPIAVRSLGTNWVIRTYFLGGLFSTLIYATLTIKFELEIIFYICAFFNLVLGFIAWEFVPETTNASLCAVNNAYSPRSAFENIGSMFETIVEYDETNDTDNSHVKVYDNFAMEKEN